MNSVTIAPLVQIKDIEPNLLAQEYSFDIKNIQGFVNQLVANLGIDLTQLINTAYGNIIVSDDAPQAADRDKLWVKTSWPYALVYLLNGQWTADYGFCGFPVNIPFLATDARMTPLPALVSLLSANDLQTYGLADTDSSSAATDRMRWYIFQPPVIPLE